MKDPEKTLRQLREDPEQVVLANSQSLMRIVRPAGRRAVEEVREVYPSKLLYEFASRLSEKHFQERLERDGVYMEIRIRDFLLSIGANPKNYNYLVEAVDTLQKTQVQWYEDKTFISVAFVYRYDHNPGTGTIGVYLSPAFCERLLSTPLRENFSFLKSNIFSLQLLPSISLYPFFKSWLGKGRYETTPERFRQLLGYNSPGFRRFSHLESRVLLPALEEINAKNDIRVSYQKIYHSPEAQRPRIKSLVFFIERKAEGPAVRERQGAEKATQPIGETPLATPVSEQTLSRLLELLGAIDIRDRPDPATLRTLLLYMVESMGAELVEKGLTGMKRTRARAHTMAFFTPENFRKYEGLDLQQPAVPPAQPAATRLSLEDYRLMFEQGRTKYFINLAQQLDGQQQEQARQLLATQPGGARKYVAADGRIRPEGLRIIGEKLAYPLGLNLQEEQALFGGWLLKHHGLTLTTGEDGQLQLS